MSANTFGHAFRVTTFGESHGPAIGCVIDGCPPNLEIDLDDVRRQLRRRRPGQSRHTTQRRESDEPEILSGLFEGRTTGSPIAILIRNEDQKPKDYDAIRDKFRPGHADFTYLAKYGIRDHRGSGRASARETAARVAAGAVARQLLARDRSVRVRGFLASMGGIDIPFRSWEDVEANPFFAPDSSAAGDLERLVDTLRREGDSCGATVEVRADNVPAGWGEPVFGKIDADIAHAMMGINAAKGVEIGQGFAAARARGSGHSDQMEPPSRFVTNNAGGILGGITNGAEIVVRVAFKPTSSITRELRTVDRHGNATTISTKGRHDPCVAIRAVPIAEAMLALVLADHHLRHRAQCGEAGQPTTKEESRQ